MTERIEMPTPTAGYEHAEVPPYVWISALFLTIVCLSFLAVAFFFRPELTFEQRRILNFIFALVAGTSTVFLGGAALLKTTGHWGRVSFGFSATAGIAVFAFVLLHPVFDAAEPNLIEPKTTESPADAQLVGVKSAIVDLRQYVESLENPDSLDQLDANAERLGNRILRFADKELSASRRFMKYQYAAFAYVAAAAAHEHRNNAVEANRLASLTLTSAEKALDFIARVDLELPPDEAEQFHAWMGRDSGSDRVRYLSTMALCIQANVQNDSQRQALARETWSKISQTYRSRFPAMATEQLRCIEESPERPSP